MRMMCGNCDTHPTRPTGPKSPKLAPHLVTRLSRSAVAGITVTAPTRARRPRTGAPVQHRGQSVVRVVAVVRAVDAPETHGMSGGRRTLEILHVVPAKWKHRHKGASPHACRAPQRGRAPARQNPVSGLRQWLHAAGEHLASRSAAAVWLLFLLRMPDPNLPGTADVAVCRRWSG